MDPVCHTLVGGALAATGLRDRTRFGMATLLIAANLPDIDVISHFAGDTASYEFRRGITHGLPALVVLPLLLALAMAGFARLWRRRGTGPPADFRWLLALSFIGVASHPVLDWTNNYGMRWLMPFVDRWFYGDTLFIIDLVMYALLGAGLVASRIVDRRALSPARRPAVVALAAVSFYIAMNFAITQYAESTVRQAYASDPPLRFMASPVPLTPFAREIVLDYPGEYRFARFRLFGTPRLEGDEDSLSKGPAGALARAAETADGRAFLHWARFPYAVDGAPGSARIRIADARYVRDIDNPRLDGFGVLELELP